MLKNNEPYRYAQPETVHLKLGRLRVSATGKKRTGGLPKGAPRPAAYGTGNTTRGIPGLDQIYEREALPPISDPKPGELKMLEATGTAEHATAARLNRRVPSKTPSKKVSPKKKAAEIVPQQGVESA